MAWHGMKFSLVAGHTVRLYAKAHKHEDGEDIAVA